MKSILIKTNHLSGGVSLAHPLAAPGQASPTVSIKIILNIPDHVPAGQVLASWRQTADVTWLGKDPMAGGRFEFDFAEIGPGRIIR